MDSNIILDNAKIIRPIELERAAFSSEESAGLEAPKTTYKDNIKFLIEYHNKISELKKLIFSSNITYVQNAIKSALTSHKTVDIILYATKHRNEIKPLIEKIKTSKDISKLKDELSKYQFSSIFYVHVARFLEDIINSSKKISKNNLKTIRSILSTFNEAITIRNIIAKININLVLKVTNSFKRYDNHFNEDLVQSGIGILIRSIDYFDPKKGFEPSTYFVADLKNRLRNVLRKHKIYQSYDVVQKFKEIKKAKEILHKELKREPFDFEIRKFLNMTKTSWDILQSKKAKVVSYDQNTDGSTIMRNSIVDKKTASPIDDASALEIKKYVDEVISYMPPSEAKILTTYFGLNELQADATLDECGDKYNLTRERVRQIKERAQERFKFISDSLKIKLTELDKNTILKNLQLVVSRQDNRMAIYKKIYDLHFVKRLSKSTIAKILQKPFRLVNNSVMTLFKQYIKTIEDVYSLEELYSLSLDIEKENKYPENKERFKNFYNIYKFYSSSLTKTQSEILKMKFGFMSKIYSEREILDALQIPYSELIKIEKDAINLLKNHNTKLYKFLINYYISNEKFLLRTRLQNYKEVIESILFLLPPNYINVAIHSLGLFNTKIKNRGKLAKHYKISSLNAYFLRKRALLNIEKFIDIPYIKYFFSYDRNYIKLSNSNRIKEKILKDFEGVLKFEMVHLPYPFSNILKDSFGLFGTKRLKLNELLIKYKISLKNFLIVQNSIFRRLSLRIPTTMLSLYLQESLRNNIKDNPNENLVDNILIIMPTLRKKYQQYLQARLGLIGENVKSLKETSSILNLSKNRTFDIKQRVIDELKAIFDTDKAVILTLKRALKRVTIRPYKLPYGKSAEKLIINEANFLSKNEREFIQYRFFSGKKMKSINDCMQHFNLSTSQILTLERSAIDSLNSNLYFDVKLYFRKNLILKSTVNGLEKIENLLFILNDIETIVITHLFGLFGETKLSQSEIARKLNISRSKVKETIKDIQKKLGIKLIKNRKKP